MFVGESAADGGAVFPEFGEEDGEASADVVFVVVAGKAEGLGGEASGAGFHDLGGEAVGEGFGWGVGAGGVAGHVDDVGVDGFDEVVGVVGLLGGFSGVAGDDVGGDGEVGDGGAEGLDDVGEGGGGVFAVHAGEVLSSPDWSGRWRNL